MNSDPTAPAAPAAPCLICEHLTRHRICNPCRARTDDHIKAIPGHYDALAPAMIPGNATTSSGRVTGTRAAPLPCRIEPLSLRVGAPYDPTTAADETGSGPGGFDGDQIGLPPIVTIVTGWEAHWRETLGWEDAPARGGTGATITASCRFLSSNWPWAADCYTQADRFAAAIGALVRACTLQVKGPSSAAYIGICPTTSASPTGEVRRCGTALYADPYCDAIRCRRCHTTWDKGQWPYLGALLAAGEDTLTAAGAYS